MIGRVWKALLTDFHEIVRESKAEVAFLFLSAWTASFWLWFGWQVALVYWIVVAQAYLAACAITGLTIRATARRRSELAARAMALLPQNISFDEAPDGRIIATARRGDGEILSVTMPEGYDPEEDGGRAIVASLMPEKLPDGVTLTLDSEVEVSDGEDR